MSEMKRERGDAINRHPKYQQDEDEIESVSCNLNPSGISITPSESTQSCIKFEKTVYKTLMNLNNEMSSTLCGGVKDINDVCFKIMECLHDMEKQERLYQHMRKSGTEILPTLMLQKKTVSSCTTMTSQTSLCDSKTLQVEPHELVCLSKTQSVSTNVTHSDGEVQCSFLCDVPNEVVETQSMQEAFKQCLESFIKDVEEVSMAYMEEVKKSEAATVEPAPSVETVKITESNKPVDGYVCKCKAVHNLHEKLIKQVEGCDSFCEFQRRMAQNLKVINGKKVNTSSSFCCYHKKLMQTVKKVAETQKKQELISQPQSPKKPNTDLALKYKDSLWFTWRPKVRKEKKKVQQQRPRSAWKKPTKPTTIEDVPRVEPVVKKIEEKPQTPPSTAPSDSFRHNSSLLTLGSNTLNCVDILEELTEKDVKPIQSEYPRRDDVPPPGRNIQDSFLYQMIYGRTNRSVLEILSSLEPPRINCSLPSCEKSIIEKTFSAPIARKLPKRPVSVQKGISRENAQAKSRKGNRGESATGKRGSSRKGIDSGSKKGSNTAAVPKKANDKVASKLQKYINDPHLRYRTTITVMPVRVYHHQLPATPTCYSSEFENKPKKILSTSSTTTTPRDNTLTKKKLWANKYPKSVCQHLVSFIQNQEPLMMERKKRLLNKTSNVAVKSKSARTAKKMVTTPSYGGDSQSTKMLSNMGLLASIDKNGLESNLQKIIEMIELKIIDIIGDPKKQNPHTFNEIEREIMAVLKQMRSIGAPQQVRRIRQENLKLTALETILDLQVVGNTIVNLTKNCSMKSQTTTTLMNVKEEDERDKDEKCFVTSACAPNLKEITSEVFLTPFMQELKKRRTGAVDTTTSDNPNASYRNIIEFLDNLSSMTDDCAIILYYRDEVYKAAVFYEAQAVFLKEILCSTKLSDAGVNEEVQTIRPSEMAIQTNETENCTIVVQSYVSATSANEAKQRHVNAEIQLEDFVEVQDADILYVSSKHLKPERNNAKFLTEFYGLLFTLMYFALTFDYECV